MTPNTLTLQVFPNLYLPLMTESNNRTMRPWRMYLPTPSWFRYRRLLARLDSYLMHLIEERWKTPREGERPDLLQKRIDGLKVSHPPPTATSIDWVVAALTSALGPVHLP